MKSAEVSKYQSYILRTYFNEEIGVVKKLNNQEKRELIELEKTLDEKSENNTNWKISSKILLS
ncbi:hypothetical protein WER97_10230 [Staphylococcus felis]|uniref:Uncharacterized protein n=1 Tax=Staphylococcus felis TaxID=46127 RepID=A0ABS0QN55_9STAP|nr:hypothetical protein [Staphylococcus felis]MBH9580492.1 hypothetical protein [Staphylococcus felis]